MLGEFRKMLITREIESNMWLCVGVFFLSCVLYYFKGGRGVRLMLAVPFLQVFICNTHSVSFL